MRAGTGPSAAPPNGHPPAIPGAYGPQGMYKGGFAGKAMFTYRYSYTLPVWERLLLRAGFTSASARVLDAPEPGHTEL